MNLEQLGWDKAFEADFQACMQAAAMDDLVPARVAREDKQSYIVYGDGRALRASVTGGFRHQAVIRTDWPAVGDWVAVRPRMQEQAASIHALLPRRSNLERKAAGTGFERQIVAANLDHLLICTGLDRDFNVRRIERYLTLAYNGGVSPVVVLTKADECDNTEACVAETRSIAIGVPVFAVSAVTGAGLEDVRGLLQTGRTLAMVGSSGVGKSTLINALLGADLMRTGAVRADDGRGRHTTTHRQLLLAPSGGVIIDTPGMRELQLSGDADGLDAAFGDIDALAADCRFRDCAHENEPGCRVRAALETGELEQERFASYCKQLRELRYLEIRDDPAAQRAQKERWKSVHKSARKWMKEKYGN